MLNDETRRHEQTHELAHWMRRRWPQKQFADRYLGFWRRKRGARLSPRDGSDTGPVSGVPKVAATMPTAPPRARPKTAPSRRAPTPHVDDSKMVGPAQNLPKAWKMIRSTVKMEQPEPFGLFHGCNREVGSPGVPSHGTVRTMSYNVGSYLKQSIEKCLGILPTGSSLKYAATPLVALPDRHGVANPSKPTVISRMAFQRGNPTVSPAVA